ncbi:hypothetical protein T484DRAFT_1810682 [Baffinella frigidus]|nr:hypothetical protein T484DRAFT_1810682 [Cryptophyta sp. CCMP2293]
MPQVLGVKPPPASESRILNSVGWIPQVLGVQAKGWRRLELRALLMDLALPLVSNLVLLIAIPYLGAFLALPLLGVRKVSCITAWRWFYPGALGGCVASALAAWAVSGITLLHDQLRDALYLVGRSVTLSTSSGYLAHKKPPHP